MLAGTAGAVGLLLVPHALGGGSGRDCVDGGIGRDQCLNAEQRQRCP